MLEGEQKVSEARATAIRYDGHSYDERTAATLADYPDDREKRTWLNLDGLHDVEWLKAIGKRYGIEPLALEDILSTDQRPKFENHGEYLFVVAKMIYPPTDAGPSVIEQVSLIISKAYLLTFQESAGDVFDPVRERLRNGRGRIRNGGSDYLAYALIDAIVDNYFLVLEHFGERLAALELELAEDEGGTQTLRAIHAMRNELIVLRKSIWPLRDVLSSLERTESKIITDATRKYIRDVHDHALQIIETLETYRDLVSSMLDLYLSTASHRMNEIMKVLTVIATIFIPLTFVAGIYGMNFETMPELSWKYGYATVWAIMAAVAISLLVFFRRRHWI